MGHIIVGTAGHIDHGKSSLVRALTGTDPDRLPEEKRRQITIDLGFAFLDDVAAIIDVPGHEKFIHHMVAGASTVDFALLVIAADDGIMPQTREHLHILRLLGLQRGAIVLTKITIADPDWRELVKDQIQSAVRGTFLESAPLFEVDSLSGTGIPELKSFLLTELPGISPRNEQGVLRIPLDRVFTIKGHGTVVTGTVISGTVEKDARVVLQPGNISARVKQLQSNARDRVQLSSGMRAALNLVSDQEPQRGQTICRPDSLLSTKRIAVRFDAIPEAPSVKDRQRVRFLIGTQEVMGRYRLLSREEGFDLALLLLDEEIVAAFGDRFIVRRYSPVDTLGGGRILDIDPVLRGVRHRATQLAALRELSLCSAERELPVWVKSHAKYGFALKRVAQAFALPLSNIESRFVGLAKDWLIRDGFIAHYEHVASWQSEVITQLTSLHKDLKATPSFSVQQVSAALPILQSALLDFTLQELVKQNKIVQDGPNYKLPGKSQVIDPKQAELLEQIMRQLSTAGFAPPSAGALAEQLGKPRVEIERTLVLAQKSERAVRLGTDLFFEQQAFAQAIQKVKQLLNRDGSVQVSDLSKALYSSRKYVVPFLEYLDSKGITERRENVRIPGRNFSTENI